MLTYKQAFLHLLKSLSCSLCEELLKNPVTIDCGHTFCWDCIRGDGIGPTDVGQPTPYICPKCGPAKEGQRTYSFNVALSKVTHSANILRQNVWESSNSPFKMDCAPNTGRESGGESECRDDCRRICDILDLAYHLPRTKRTSRSTMMWYRGGDSGVHSPFDGSLACSCRTSTPGRAPHYQTPTVRKLCRYDGHETPLSSAFSSCCSMSSMQQPPYLSAHSPCLENKQDGPCPRSDSPSCSCSTSSMQQPPYLSVHSPRKSIKRCKRNYKWRIPTWRADQLSSPCTARAGYVRQPFNANLRKAVHFLKLKMKNIPPPHEWGFGECCAGHLKLKLPKAKFNGSCAK